VMEWGKGFTVNNPVNDLAKRRAGARAGAVL
jgi:hypothetical protein